MRFWGPEVFKKGERGLAPLHTVGVAVSENVSSLRGRAALGSLEPFGGLASGFWGSCPPPPWGSRHALGCAAQGHAEGITG